MLQIDAIGLAYDLEPGSRRFQRLEEGLGSVADLAGGVGSSFVGNYCQRRRTPGSASRLCGGATQLQVALYHSWRESIESSL